MAAAGLQPFCAIPGPQMLYIQNAVSMAAAMMSVQAVGMMLREYLQLSTSDDDDDEIYSLRHLSIASGVSHRNKKPENQSKP